MSFLTGGGGGQTQTTNSNSTSNVNYAPWYTGYAQNLLERGQDLANQPFQPYDISKMFAPFQPAQEQAFKQIQNNQTAYYPYINSAGQMLDSVSSINPVGAGMPFINQAAQGPTGMQAGAPYLSLGTQTWNPQVQANYTNPFMAGSVDFANRLATQNFLERTIPGVNAQFVKSGGGLGGKNYADYMGRTVRDFSNNMLGQNQTAMAGNYWQGANQFNQDMNRYLNAGTNLGGLANSTMGTLGQLGQTAAGIANTGIGSGINLSTAYSGLGGALSNLSNANTNQLLQMGNLQQQQAQNPLTAAYQQYLQQQQYPYNQLSWLANLSSGLRIPSTQTTQSSSTQNVASNSSPSILGSIMGIGSMVGSIPGVGSWLGGLFGGGGSPSMTGFSQVPAGQYGPLAGNGITTGFRHGGAVQRLATGGLPARNALGMRGYGGTPVGALSGAPAPSAPQRPAFGGMGGFRMPFFGGYGMPFFGNYGPRQPLPMLGAQPPATAPNLTTTSPGSIGMQPMQPPTTYASGGNVMSASGDLGPAPGGALGRVPAMKAEEEEKPKEPTAAEAWQRSGMDAGVTAPGYRNGGAIRRYSQGGTIPVVRGVNNRARPALSAIAQRAKPPVPMPRPPSGALARVAAPMASGALSAAR